MFYIFAKILVLVCSSGVNGCFSGNLKSSDKAELQSWKELFRGVTTALEVFG